MRMSRLMAVLLDRAPLTVVDVGAAGGLHRRWDPVAGRMRLVGFEPLEPEREVDGNLTLPYALGSSRRRGQLLVTRRVSMTSFLPPARTFLARFWDKPQHTDIVDRIDVDLHRLDDLASIRGIRPDMLKIDVQGAEHDVLLGAAECLDRHVIAAEIEVSFIERYEGLTPFCGIVDFMDRQGFELIDIWRIKRYRHRNSASIIDPGTVPGLRAGRIAFCDALFLRRDSRLLDEVGKSRERAAKTMALCLVYGKADLAARVHDTARHQFDGEDNRRIDRFWQELSRRRGRPALHRALDKWSKRV